MGTERGVIARLQANITSGVVLLVAFSYAVRRAYMLDRVGEPDLARLITAAASWHATGKLPPDTYTARTSPLYLIFIRGLVGAGASLDAVTATLNEINVLCGALLALPLFLLWRRISNPTAALAAVVLLQIIPALWVGSLYGMPHIPALLFATFALVLFLRALDAPGRSLSLPYAAGAALLIAVACALKADIILICAAFPALAWCIRRVDWRALSASLVIPALGLGATMLLTRLALPDAIAHPMQAAEWSHRFPAHFALLFKAWGVRLDSAGLYVVAVGVVGGAWLFLRGKFRREIVLALVWGLPAVVFWGVRGGNSARHLAAAAVPFAWLAGVSLMEIFKTREVRMLSVACVLQFNYTSGGSTSSTARPGSRLLLDAHKEQQYTRWLDDAARRAAADPAPKKLYVGTAGLPYYIYETENHAKSFSYRRNPHESYGGQRLRVVRKNGGKQIVETLTPNEFRYYRSRYRGWSVWSRGRRVQVARK